MISRPNDDDVLQQFVAAFNSLLDQHVGRGPGRVSVGAFAGKAGVGRSSLYDYRRGTTLPDAESLDLILAAVETPQSQRLTLRHLRDAAAAARLSPRAEPVDVGSLPRRHHGFVTRQDELMRLDGRMVAARDGTGPGVINVVGMPGVGKTALCLEWIYTRLATFADPPLYVDLRGYTSEAFRAHEEAAIALLLALGVPRSDHPNVRREQITLLRRRTASLRSVVVLDNVEHPQEIRDLIPGSPESLTIVVSRSQLDELVVAPGAAVLNVPLLNLDDGMELLRRNSPDAAGLSDEALRRLVVSAKHHPLALTRILHGRPRSVLILLVRRCGSDSAGWV